MKDRRRPARPVWQFCKWGMLISLVAGLCYAFTIYRSLDSKLKRAIEAHCSELFPSLSIRIRSAQVIIGEGLQIRGLRVLDPHGDRHSGLLLDVDELFLAGPVDYQQLLAKRLQIKRVVIRRPHLHLVNRQQDGWNIARLFPLPRGSGQCVPLEIENGLIEIVDMRKSPTSGLTLRDVQLSLTPFALTTEDGAPLWNLRGTMTGDFLRRIDVEGSIDPGSLRTRLAGRVDSIEFGPEFQGALPLEITERLESLQHLRAQLALTFQLYIDMQSPPRITFDVAGQIVRGRIDDSRLPHPISDIRASFACRNSGIEVRNLSATMGQTVFNVSSFTLFGWTLSDPFDLEARCEHLEFDPAVVQLLPRVLQEEWPKYFPQGLVDLSIQFSSRREGSQFRVVADLQNVSFAYYKFPYRLQQTYGRMELTPERLTIQLVARANGQPVEIRGQVLTPLTSPRSQIFLSGKEITLDDRLVDAILNPKTRKTIRSLQLSGTADFWLSLWQDKPGEELHRHLEATLNRCSIKYQGFPYPISNITGRLIMRDEAWSFEELKGVQGSAQITADGTLLSDASGSILTLRFRGRQIRLDNTLRDAFLLEHVRSAWNDLQPNGLIDVEGVLSWHTGEPMKLSFSARPSDRSVTLEPTGFPYRMERVDGTFIYENGTILVNDFQAFHGNTELRANVTCTLLPGGGWQLVFSNLWVDRLVADRSLLLALPEKLSRSFARLNIQGPLAIRGEFTIGRCGASDNGQEQQTATLGEPQNLSSLSSAWNVVVTLVQNDLGAAIPIRNINGRIFLRGEYRNGHLFSLGHFDLDALTVQGLPLFRFYGPFSLDNEILFLGDYQNRFPGPEQGSSVPAARYVTAELFGGQIMGGGWIRMSPEFSFDLAGSLVAADFQQILRQYHHNDGVNARGKVDVTVRIRGKGDDVQGLSGYGNFQFREADIYELPIMLALLKLFDLRRPDATTAFTESTGSFRIAGRHIYLDSITFRGEMFHLTGQGEMDFDRNVRLVLRVMLGKKEMPIPVIKEIFRGASEQIVLVHVGGTIYEPIVRRESFPGVNQAIQRLQNTVESLGQREASANWW